MNLFTEVYTVTVRMSLGTRVCPVQGVTGGTDKTSGGCSLC